MHASRYATAFATAQSSRQHAVTAAVTIHPGQHRMLGQPVTGRNGGNLMPRALGSDVVRPEHLVMLCLWGAVVRPAQQGQCACA